MASPSSEVGKNPGQIVSVTAWLHEGSRVGQSRFVFGLPVANNPEIQLLSAARSLTIRGQLPRAGSHCFNEFVRQANGMMFYIMGQRLRPLPFSIIVVDITHFVIRSPADEATKRTSHAI